MEISRLGPKESEYRLTCNNPRGMARLNTLPRPFNRSMPWNNYDAILTTAYMYMFIVQMIDVLRPLRGINFRLQHIKLGKKKAEAFLEILKELKYHTRSTQLTIAFL